MTLQEVISCLKKAVLANPLIHTWIDDFNFTSAYHDIKYGAAALDVGLFDVDKKGMMTVNANLYCFDRMYDEPSDSALARTEDNSLSLYSKCMQIVQNSIKTMDDRIGIVEAAYQPFKHRYTDDCAGVLCQLTLTAPFTICYDDFEEEPTVYYSINATISHGSVAAYAHGSPVQLPYTDTAGTRVILTVIPDEGYRFAFWNDGNRNNPRTVILNSNIELSCNCLEDVIYEVTATCEHCSVIGEGQYHVGEVVTLKATVDPHYHLDEEDWQGLPYWADFSENNTRVDFTIDRDYDITISASIDRFTFTTFATYGTITDGGTYDYGTQHTVTATPITGFMCTRSSWLGLPSDATFSADFTQATFILDQDRSIICNCIGTTTHILSFSAVSHGSVVGQVSGETVTSPTIVHEGELVKLTAIPDTGYVFSRWSDTYTDNPYYFTMPTMDVTITAVFEQAVEWSGLKFTSTGDSTVAFVRNNWQGVWTVEYSFNGRTWNLYTIGRTINLSDGQFVYFRGQKDRTHQGNYNSGDKYNFFTMTGSIDASGDVTSMLNGVGGNIDLFNYGMGALFKMFSNCTALKSVPSLPSTKLYDRCYQRTFEGCTSLTSVPSNLLPTVSLAREGTITATACYNQMFHNCTSLVVPPTLPATTLSLECYSGMFQGCTSLATAPALPALTLTYACYAYMFYGCSSLVNAPILPAITYESYPQRMEWYAHMFEGCASLTGPVYIYYPGMPKGASFGWTEGMFTNSGTDRPSTPTDYNKIYVSGYVNYWENPTFAGVDINYWRAEVISEEEQTRNLLTHTPINS